MKNTKRKKQTLLLQETRSKLHIYTIMCLCLFFLGLGSLNAYSQDTRNSISGVISDDSGELLVGATVMKSDASAATITDIDGRFSLNASVGDEFTVSYIGYLPFTFKVTEQTTYNVTLRADRAQELETVIVTALGIRRSQKALSYNAQQVSQDDLMKNKDANFVNSLAGKVAGITINASSSGVGGASKVVMRGTKGIAQSSQALYVIDGIPMFNTGGGGDTEFGSRGATEGIADINPDDIESLTVLSGAAASALYGNNAANGVVLITTKRGKAGRTSVTVSQTTEFSNPFVMYDFQNRYGTSTGTDRSWGPLLNSANYMGYSPLKDYFQTGVVTTESFSLSTGSEKNQTYLSAAAINSEGVVPNNKYDRYNFTFRNTTSLLDDKMTIDVGLSYIKQRDLNMVNQGTYMNPLVTAYLFPRGADWADIQMFEHYNIDRKIYTQNWSGWGNTFMGQNPYWNNYRNLRESNRDRYMLNASVNYKLLEWLDVSGRVRVDNANTQYTEKLHATTNTFFTGGSSKGSFSLNEGTDKQLYGDIIVTINKELFEDLSLHANIGASLNDVQYRGMYAGGGIREVDGVTNRFTLSNTDHFNNYPVNSSRREQTQAVFASAELGYKGAYYLTLTARNDWPSQLAGTHSAAKGFFYPSVGTSFVLSEIFDLPQQISYLKLRGSFARVGLPIPAYLANPTFEWDGSSRTYQQRSHYPLSDLKPEQTDSWEVGVTARVFKNFTIDASAYNTQSYNQTFDPQISASSGYTSMIIQSGRIQNRGIELALGYQNKWKDFGWASNYTFSANQNKIIELVRNAVHPRTGAILNKDNLDMGGLAQAHFFLAEGGTLGDLYSFSDLQRDENGYIYVDENGEVLRDSRAGRTKLGSVFPKANMAWRNDFSWKGFNAAFMISARVGGIVHSATQAILDIYGVSEATALARDNGGVVINGGDVVGTEAWYSVVGGTSSIPQYYTYSATNVRLQEASIGYTFDKKQLWDVAELTVSLVGRNLLMIYNKAPFDPETVASTNNYYQGIDNFMMPSTRNIGFTISAKF